MPLALGFSATALEPCTLKPGTTPDTTRPHDNPKFLKQPQNFLTDNFCSARRTREKHQMPTNSRTQDTLATFDARLALLDALIAKTEALQKASSAFELESRTNLAFAYPLAHCVEWGALGAALYFGDAVLPCDSRWEFPTLVTGPVDPSVAFAVAVSL